MKPGDFHLFKFVVMFLKIRCTLVVLYSLYFIRYTFEIYSNKPNNNNLASLFIVMKSFKLYLLIQKFNRNCRSVIFPNRISARK